MAQSSYSDGMELWKSDQQRHGWARRLFGARSPSSNGQNITFKLGPILPEGRPKNPEQKADHKRCNMRQCRDDGRGNSQ